VLRYKRSDPKSIGAEAVMSNVRSSRLPLGAPAYSLLIPCTTVPSNQSTQVNRPAHHVVLPCRTGSPAPFPHPG
jgi:hypothetical protein